MEESRTRQQTCQSVHHQLGKQEKDFYQESDVHTSDKMYYSKFTETSTKKIL